MRANFRWALGSALVAAAARAVTGPLPLNYYDIGYALIWGREIVHGHAPDYQTPAASTPHPLATAAGALAALFGIHGSWILVQAILFLAFGIALTALAALVLAAFRSLPAAALAAGALGLSPPFLTDGLGGSGLADLPALALVLCAAALVARRPRRGVAPLALLALAGLLRPEAWGLAGVYWLLLALSDPRPGRRRLLELAALVAVSPVLWTLSDFLIVSNPTYSLTHTQAASTRAFFTHGIRHVPSEAARNLRALVGLPVLIIGSLGALAALARAESRRAAALPLGLLAVALTEFAALGLANVPLLERFLLLAAAMLAAMFAWALTRLHEELGGPLQLAALGAAVLVILYIVASDASRIRHIPRDQRASVNAQADLISLARTAPVTAALKTCGNAVYAPRFTLVSLLAYDFALPPRLISRTRAEPPARGVIVAPASLPAGVWFGVTASRLHILRTQTLKGFRQLYGNRSWLVYTRGCG